MALKNPRVSWLAVGQLIATTLLLAGSLWFVADNRLQQSQHVMNQTEIVRSLPKPLPPYAFPDGSRTLFPNYRLVALYGTPGAPVLGALGQQNLQKSVARVIKISQQYQSHSAQPIMPTFEIIASVASADPTQNGDYSDQLPLSRFEPWIKEALKNNIYVVLDLQSGRSDFLSQAKELKPLLEYPNVGLALDPEWRLKPNQKPLVQIGSVSIDEINKTAGWLAELTRQARLPQKLFLLHEFRLSSLPNRNNLNTTHRELAYSVQMDGQGPQSMKQHTWQQILRNAPPNTHFGWKNFLQKDPVVLTPAQTMAIRPQPWYISYQ